MFSSFVDQLVGYATNIAYVEVTVILLCLLVMGISALCETIAAIIIYFTYSGRSSARDASLSYPVWYYKTFIGDSYTPWRSRWGFGRKIRLLPGCYAWLTITASLSIAGMVLMLAAVVSAISSWWNLIVA